MVVRLLAAAWLTATAAAFIQKRVDVTAAKGKFMVHMLHSAYFFPQTVEVKWSASAQGKPTLPVWMHLFPSRHRAIAYLIGTPVTPLSQVTVHVIAKRLDNYRSAEQFVTINLNDDVRFNSSTHQIVDLRVRNIEAEDFVASRDDKIRRLEKAIHETFRGKGVNPYIYDVFPEVRDLPDNFYRLAGKRKIATIVQVGTQRGFHPNVHNIAEGLNRHPDYCGKSSYIPMEKHFRGSFDIDWCKFELRNVTTVKALEEHAQTLAAQSPRHRADKTPAAGQLQVDKARSRKDMEDMDVLYRSNYPLRGQSLFESVLVFPLLAALCIILLIVLSLIFFGRREGQHWRDYKTPKERLQEYLDVRESQRHLREMSVQRQMLFMSEEPGGKSTTPMSINTFLQPRQSSLSSSAARPPPPPIRQSSTVGGFSNGTPYLTSRGDPLSASQPRLPIASSPAPSYHRMERRANSSVMASPAAEAYRTPRSSIGKQTVAEAARVTGSSLDLYRYRNPLDEFPAKDDNYYDTEATPRLNSRSDYATNGIAFPNYRSRPMLGDATDYRYSTVR